MKQSKGLKGDLSRNKYKKATKTKQNKKKKKKHEQDHDGLDHRRR